MHVGNILLLAFHGIFTRDSCLDEVAVPQRAHSNVGNQQPMVLLTVYPRQWLIFVEL